MENMNKNGRAQEIWDFFLPRIGNKYGTAALLGVMFWCSNLDPMSIDKPNDICSESQYTSDVDTSRAGNQKYPLEKFRGDGLGYGLMRWKVWWRKQSLYNRAKKQGVSIGDLKLQLNYIWEELNGPDRKEILNALKNADSTQEPAARLFNDFLDRGVRGEPLVGVSLCQQYAANYYTSYVVNKSRLVSVSYIYITAPKAAVRARATIIGKRIETATKGEEYQYMTTSKNGMWYCVFREGHNNMGWIHKKQCSEIFDRMEPVESRDTNKPSYGK